ncbi:MAG: tetraacyldisaccharide 4'-kinase [Bacteroidetes bacterium]|nr:tetraacyldisaccharide 4'-kinase [Bacteroidota bacterium]
MRPSLWFYPLVPLYWLGQKLHRGLHQSGILAVHHPRQPVIGIGNIQAGGSGKTPLAMHLIGLCQERGLSTAYVSRGYGRQGKSNLLVDMANLDPRIYGDEACMVASALPECTVIVANRRSDGIALAPKADIVFVDDAFQHWSLKPTLHIVTMPFNQRSSRQKLLPAGPLREGLSALCRADMLVITNCPLDGCDSKALALELKLSPSVALHCAQSLMDMRQPVGHEQPWQGQTALLVAGLGQSQSVLDQWKALLKSPHAATLALPDHASLSGRHWASITQAMKQSQAKAWVTSTKDLARLSEEQITRFPLYVIPLSMRFPQEVTDIFNQLEKLCAKKGQPLPLPS